MHLKRMYILQLFDNVFKSCMSLLFFLSLFLSVADKSILQFLINYDYGTLYFSL